ncbi:hypothetical protein ACCO45_011321 [Purpureocillium lilacinum]|uniref:Uncharacterized protein n=1 Tax=Purpureocillium lilacinum TaxID=33203 RepID=A0ACC4DIA0_PURLI
MLFSLHPSQGHWASSTAETVASGSVASQILLRGSTKLRDAASVLPFPPGSTSPEGGSLAKGGLSVLLLSAAPKPAPCGGFVMALAAPLAAVSPDSALYALNDGLEQSTARIAAPSGTSRVVCSRQDRPAAVLSRHPV